MADSDEEEVEFLRGIAQGGVEQDSFVKAHALAELAQIHASIGDPASAVRAAQAALQVEMDALSSGLRPKATVAMPTISGHKKRIEFLRVEAPDTAALLSADALQAAVGLQWGRASRLLGRAIELDPLSPRLLVANVVAFLHTGDIDLAADAAATAVEVLEASCAWSSLRAAKPLSRPERAALDLRLLLVRIYRTMGAADSERNEVCVLSRAIHERGQAAAAHVAAAATAEDLSAIEALVEKTLEQDAGSTAVVADDAELWLRGADELLSAAGVGEHDDAVVPAGAAGRLGADPGDHAGGDAEGPAPGALGPGAASTELWPELEAVLAGRGDGETRAGPSAEALIRAALDRASGHVARSMAAADGVLAADGTCRSDALHQRSRGLLAVSVRSAAAGALEQALAAAAEALSAELAIGRASPPDAPASGPAPGTSGSGGRAYASAAEAPSIAFLAVPRELERLLPSFAAEVRPCDEVGNLLRRCGAGGGRLLRLHCPRHGPDGWPHPAFWRGVAGALVTMRRGEEALRALAVVRALSDAFAVSVAPRLRPSEADSVAEWASSGAGPSSSLWCPLWTADDTAAAADALCDAAAARESPQDALTLLQEAADAAPADVVVRLLRAQAALRCGRPALALSDAETALEAGCQGERRSQAKALVTAASSALSAGRDVSAEPRSRRVETAELRSYRSRLAAAEEAEAARGAGPATGAAAHVALVGRRRVPAARPDGADSGAGAGARIEESLAASSASSLRPAAWDEAAAGKPTQGASDLLTAERAAAAVRSVRVLPAAAALPASAAAGQHEEGRLLGFSTKSLPRATTASTTRRGGTASRKTKLADTVSRPAAADAVELSRCWRSSLHADALTAARTTDLARPAPEGSVLESSRPDLIQQGKDALSTAGGASASLGLGRFMSAPKPLPGDRTIKSAEQQRLSRLLRLRASRNRKS